MDSFGFASVWRAARLVRGIRALCWELRRAARRIARGDHAARKFGSLCPPHPLPSLSSSVSCWSRSACRLLPSFFATVSAERIRVFPLSPSLPPPSSRHRTNRLMPTYTALSFTLVASIIQNVLGLPLLLLQRSYGAPGSVLGTVLSRAFGSLLLSRWLG